MSETTIYAHTDRDTIRRLVDSIPQEMVASGSVQSTTLEQCGLMTLAKIRDAFLVKSRGGTDEAEGRWQPLAPATIAYRHSRSSAERRRPERPSQALTRRQRDRWWDLYRQGMAIYRGDRGHAAARAWFVLKEEGATTLFDKYSTSQVEIMIDTGLLLDSLSPNSGSEHQIFAVTPGQVVVGTARKGAKSHHVGIPGRLPQRCLWPATNSWPSTWWQALLQQLRHGVVDLAVQMIQGLP